jgi:hypothetical protein
VKIPNKIYHFLGYNNLGLMIEQERKHWLLKTDKMKRLQDKNTGDVYQGKIDNMGSDVVIETSKMPLKVPTNGSFKWVESSKFDKIVNVEKSTFTYSSAVNGLMFLRIISTNYPLNIQSDDVHHYRVKFNDCQTCLIPFGGSPDTDDVFVGKWIKTNTPPTLQVMNTEGQYVNNIPMQFDKSITNVTYYYPLEGSLQPIDITRDDDTTYTTAGIVDDGYIGYPLMWFTCDQSAIGPSIKLENNYSGLGKQLIMAGNAGNESKYKAHLYVNVDGTQDATPDDSPTTNWMVSCTPVGGKIFNNDLTDFNVNLNSVITMSDGVTTHEIPITMDGNSNFRMSRNDAWQYVSPTLYQIPLTTFASNCVATNPHNDPLIPVFDVSLDTSIPFTQTTKDSGYAGIRATSSNTYSDIQTRYPYNLNKWTGLPKWLQTLPDSEDSVPQHTIVYALHNTPTSVAGIPETLQTAALILDPGKCHIEDPQYNIEQYNRSHQFVEYVLSKPPTTEEGEELVAKRSDPNFGITEWLYSSRSGVMTGFKELVTLSQFVNEPWLINTDYVWYGATKQWVIDKTTIPEDPDQRLALYNQTMLELLNHTAYNVYTDNYIHDVTSLSLLDVYNRYHKYVEFVENHPLSNEEMNELMSIFRKFGKFPIAMLGDLDNNGVVDEYDIAIVEEVTHDDPIIIIDHTDVRGDVNLDGRIDHSDAELLRKILLGPSYADWDPDPNKAALQKIQADVHDDGEIDMTDVVAINRMLGGLDVPYIDVSTIIHNISVDISFTEFEILAGDFNGDGIIDTSDLEALRQYLQQIREGHALYPQWRVPPCQYVSRVLEEFKRLLPYTVFTQMPNHYTADYIWNDIETHYESDYPPVVFDNLYTCVLSQLIATTAYRIMMNNYIHDVSEIFQNDERGRVYVLSNDPVEYINNKTAEHYNDQNYKKPDCTVARICDIPTSAMQLMGVSGLSPTQVVDKKYVRQHASYNIDDKDRLYNQTASRWVRPSALDIHGLPISSNNTYVFASVDDLKRVDLIEHNDFRIRLNLVPTVDPLKVKVANIVNPGRNYETLDYGIIMIGGYAFNYHAISVDNAGGVKIADITPTDMDYQIHISNFDMMKDATGKPLHNGYTETYGTSPITGRGTGLKLRLYIQDYQDLKPKYGDVFDDLFAFVSEDDGIWIYSYIIDQDDPNVPKGGTWTKCDQITQFEKSNFNVDGYITSSDTIMTTVLPQRRQISVPPQANGDIPTIDTLTTSSFINIIDTRCVPMDLPNVSDGITPKKSEVDLCAWRCDGVKTFTASEKTANSVIDTLDKNGLIHEQCHVFWKWLSTDPNDKDFEAGIIYQGFNNYRSTDTQTFLPQNDFKWKKYITSNANTSVVWNTDEAGVMMWIYDQNYHIHEKYAIDIDSKELTIVRKKETWKDFEFSKSSSGNSIKLVDSNNRYQYSIYTNCPCYSNGSEITSSNSKELHTQYNFHEIIGINDHFDETNPYSYVCAGNWRLVFPRLHSFSFKNDTKNVSYNAIEMQVIAGTDIGNVGDIIDIQSGYQVNQKTILMDRNEEGVKLKMFNNDNSTWEQV